MDEKLEVLLQRVWLMGPGLFILACLLGFATGLACVELDEPAKVRFGYRSIAWTFLMPMAIGFLAGRSAGERTIKISGGRDPEYETVTVRHVSDGQRWQRADTVCGQVFFPLALGLGASAAWVAFERRKGRAWTLERIYQLRAGALAGLAIGFLILASWLEG